MKSWLFIVCITIYGSVYCQPAKTKPIDVSDSNYKYRSPSADGTGKYYMGREIAKVMDASGADWLERPSRVTEENTDVTIANMKLSPSSVIADIGAGTGFYTFRMASKVPEGKVYAVELQDELIRILQEKKIKSGSKNVEVIKGDTLQVNLPDTCLDLAIMVDVYHELSWPKEIIQSIRKSLKPDGKILLIEYRGEDPSVRIKPLHKTTVAQLTREMKSNGFILDHRVDVLPIQHFLLFRKDAP